MRVFYRSVPTRQPSHDHAAYEQTGPVTFCCREMCQEWGVLVGFGVKGLPRTISREVNLFTLHPPGEGDRPPGHHGNSVLPVARGGGRSLLGEVRRSR
jgi:hypothetical protein